MLVKATYSDASNKNITDDTVSPAMLSVSDTEVTISYTEDGIEKSVTQSITVYERPSISAGAVGNH
ncbi:MAG: hypothetical protein EOM64_07225 [Erysipelotrichia bacterium]|nr:hypothetical protein [Erysipelotrichia bacterium]